MKFINLTCRKGDDFYITSSEVVQERHPGCTYNYVVNYLMGQAQSMLERGWDVELKQTDLETA